MAQVKQCECSRKHEYQDTKYGMGKRVVTPIAKKSSTDTQRYRCTVCACDLKSTTSLETVHPKE